MDKRLCCLIFIIFFYSFFVSLSFIFNLKNPHNWGCTLVQRLWVFFRVRESTPPNLVRFMRQLWSAFHLFTYITSILTEVTKYPMLSSSLRNPSPKLGWGPLHAQWGAGSHCFKFPKSLFCPSSWGNCPLGQRTQGKEL